MPGFDLKDYATVQERIAWFKEKHPDGSLQADVVPREQEGFLVGWFAVAYAYRTPDDSRPGKGTAYEPVPGKTPYTRDSEAMNAETSAWGRAINALGFPTSKLASREEVEARQAPAAGTAGPAKQPRKKPQGKQADSGAAAGTPNDPVPGSEPGVSVSQALANEDGFATPEQRQELFAVAKEVGVSNSRLRELLQEVTGQTVTAQIPAGLYQTLVDRVVVEGAPFE